jgi:1-aminocyclopropane-1-carboxylate deaminase
MLQLSNTATVSLSPVNQFAGLFFDPITVQTVPDPEFSARGVDLKVVRFDQMDLLTGGNKWFKLAPYLNLARERGIRSLLSFGGAYSNHIAAVAAAGQRYNFRTAGIIRGEEVVNTTLNRARAQGMKLHFVSRSLYRELRGNLQHPFLDDFREDLIIPEGGSGELGMEGAAMMHEFIPMDADHLLLATGTGTTAAGISKKLLPHQQLHCINVAASASAITSLVSGSAVQVYEAYHFGRYARITSGLEEFCHAFSASYAIPLEPVYTGKAMFGAYDLLRQGAFEAGSKLCFLHTGGLQYQNS